jgi:AsmA protein
VLPDAPFDSSRWDSVDADVKIRAGTINRPDQLPLQHLNTRIVMKDKVLSLDPLDFGIAGGKIAGTVRLDGRQEPIKADLRMGVTDLKLGELFPTVEKAKASVGDVSGMIELSGSGDSVAKMLGSANGKIGVFVDGGEVSKFLMNAVAIDLWGLARTRIEGDDNVEIRCAVADFGVENGVAKANALVFDTGLVNVGGEGTISLKDERMDLKLNPDPKDKSVASLNSPLYIRGTFSQPKVGPDMKRLAVKGAGALALGVINPLLAVLPLLNRGDGKDSNCAALITAATSSDRSAAAGGTAKRPPSKSAR